jgi:peroxiredoxin
MTNLLELPPNLPVPQDDGACQHLEGRLLPSIKLLSTSGQQVDLSQLTGTIVLYIFPMIGHPDAPPMVGWNEIPGARGCTPQSCAFRDIHSDFQKMGVTVFGLSAQAYDDQVEAVARLHLPFELLNDATLAFANALALPTFEYRDLHLIKRLTLIIQDGSINKVFYPVFPPNQNAAQVFNWLETR